MEMRDLFINRYKVFLLSVIAALLMASIPAPASGAAAANSKQGEPGFTKNVMDLDKEMVEKAQEALKPFINEEIEFEGVQYSHEIDGKKVPVLYSKAFRTVTNPVKGDKKIRAAAVAIKEQTGEVYEITLDPQLLSLDEGIRTKLKSTIKETDQNLSYDDIDTLSISGTSGEITAIGSYLLVFDSKSGKVRTAIYDVPMTQLNQETVQAVRQAVGALTSGKKLTFDSIQRLVVEGTDSYSFSEYEQSIIVWVDRATNKVEAIVWSKESPVSRSKEELKKKFAKPKYTAAQAIKTMNPMIKKIFGIDVTGYQVKVEDNNYTFLKKGSPSISAAINEKGKVYALTRELVAKSK
ncbi:hypothetical protein SAMN04488689_107131 [Paenibacillus sp. cl6col]|uniref:hypothetical protein n=1 Tax=Paenibacillus sp. cl6col TaxID=1761878 RepID=UPI0008806EF3|nr:hypothetical protein [Paenibacillus sp. cl6col]SDF82455.1 hypothetical protein SAMN04488689_107131 [Paenibacillus sp. cl6col]